MRRFCRSIGLCQYLHQIIFQPSSVVRLGNGIETLALLMLVAYLSSQISITERTALIYLTKQILAGAFANIRGRGGSSP